MRSIATDQSGRKLGARMSGGDNGRAPALKFSGALRRHSPCLLGRRCSLEVAAMPQQPGATCDGSHSRRKDKGVAIFDYALGNRPSTGRGEVGGRLFPQRATRPLVPMKSRRGSGSNAAARSKGRRCSRLGNPGKGQAWCPAIVLSGVP
jgi:hypothetical protein